MKNSRGLVCDVGEGRVFWIAESVTASERTVVNPSIDGGADGTPYTTPISLSKNDVDTPKVPGTSSHTTDSDVSEHSQRSGSSLKGTSGELTRSGSVTLAAEAGVKARL